VLKGDPNAERVSLIGEQQDIRRYLAASDAFILNSHSEGLPRALLEAMAMGVPAIAPQVGGIPELLRGRGWLTDPGQPDTVVSAMQQVCLLAEEAKTRAAAARDYVSSHYNSLNSVDHYRALLREELTSQK
jgi:glycosyltransferase involved in cell wall biosynthesis